jgi:hypothetical protein
MLNKKEILIMLNKKEIFCNFIFIITFAFLKIFKQKGK